MVVQYGGTYKGRKYQILAEGYGYKIFSKDGKSFGTFQPYFGNRVFDLGTTEARVKEMRRQVYNDINRDEYRKRGK